MIRPVETAMIAVACFSPSSLRRSRSFGSDPGAGAAPPFI
jgi:hypothetical protein